MELRSYVNIYLKMYNNNIENGYNDNDFYNDNDKYRK